MNKLKRVKSTDLQVLRSILNDELVIDADGDLIFDNVTDVDKRSARLLAIDSGTDNKIDLINDENGKIADKEKVPREKQLIKTHSKPFMITRIESKHKFNRAASDSASVHSNSNKSPSVPVYKSVHYNNIINTENRLNRKYEDLAKLLNEEILMKTVSLCDQSVNEARQLIQNSLATSRIVSSFLIDIKESGRKIPIGNINHIIERSDQINGSNDRIIGRSDQNQQIIGNNDRIVGRSDPDQQIYGNNDRIINQSDPDQQINGYNDRIIKRSGPDQQINGNNDRIINRSDPDQQIYGNNDRIINRSDPGQQIHENDNRAKKNFDLDQQISGLINQNINGERLFDIHESIVNQFDMSVATVTSASDNCSKPPQRASTEHMLTSDQPFIRSWLINKNRQLKLERRLKKEQLRIERAISMSAIAVQEHRKVAAEESFKNWIKEKKRQVPTTAKQKEESTDTESDISPAQAGRQPKPPQMHMRRSMKLRMLRPKSCASFNINKDAKMKVSGQHMSILSNDFGSESCRCSTKIDYSKFISRKDTNFIRPETAVPQPRQKDFPPLIKSTESPVNAPQKTMKKLKKKRKQPALQTELRNNFPIREIEKSPSIYSDGFSDPEKEVFELTPRNTLGKDKTMATDLAPNTTGDSAITSNGLSRITDGIADEISDNSTYGST